MAERFLIEVFGPTGLDVRKHELRGDVSLRPPGFELPPAVPVRPWTPLIPDKLPGPKPPDTTVATDELQIVTFATVEDLIDAELRTQAVRRSERFDPGTLAILEIDTASVLRGTAFEAADTMRDQFGLEVVALHVQRTR